MEFNFYDSLMRLFIESQHARDSIIHERPEFKRATEVVKTLTKEILSSIPKEKTLLVCELVSAMDEIATMKNFFYYRMGMLDSPELRKSLGELFSDLSFLSSESGSDTTKPEDIVL